MAAVVIYIQWGGVTNGFVQIFLNGFNIICVCFLCSMTMIANVVNSLIRTVPQRQNRDLDHIVHSYKWACTKTDCSCSVICISDSLCYL